MNRERLKVTVRGAVQGVGFRPFVYRLATELKLSGWVLNSARGVFIEVEGTRASLDRFLLRLEKEKPVRAVLQSFESSFLDSVNYCGFEIRPSAESRGENGAYFTRRRDVRRLFAEVFDRNRRFRYPFTNCTNCGPRFSIIESLPYDRANTSMKKFMMCAECDREYHDPSIAGFTLSLTLARFVGRIWNFGMPQAKNGDRRSRLEGSGESSAMDRFSP